MLDCELTKNIGNEWDFDVNLNATGKLINFKIRAKRFFFYIFSRILFISKANKVQMNVVPLKREQTVFCFVFGSFQGLEFMPRKVFLCIASRV